MLNLEKIGTKIAELRKDKHMLQNELADALHVTHQAVSKWENGKSIPSIDILYDLTQLFDVSIDYLLNDTDIRDDDYETLFQNFPRQAVVKKLLQSDKLSKELEKVFYLLNKSERKQVIEQIARGKIKVDIDCYWHLLSKEERIYTLGILKSRKKISDIDIIYDQLNLEERQMLHMNMRKGTVHIRTR